MKIKRKNIILFLGLLVIGILSFGLWYNNQLEQSKKDAANTPSRAVIESPKSSSSSIPSVNELIVPATKDLKQGSFVSLDPLHYGSGQVKVINENEQYFVEFQDDFGTNPDGPDLFVWLVSEQSIGGAVNGVNTSKDKYINLGKLTKFNGKQRYSITKAEFEKFNYAVVIWCQAFNVQFTNAVLK